MTGQPDPEAIRRQINYATTREDYQAALELDQQWQGELVTVRRTTTVAPELVMYDSQIVDRHNFSRGGAIALRLAFELYLTHATPYSLSNAQNEFWQATITPKPDYERTVVNAPRLGGLHLLPIPLTSH